MYLFLAVLKELYGGGRASARVISEFIVRVVGTCVEKSKQTEWIGPFDNYEIFLVPLSTRVAVNKSSSIQSHNAP